MVPSQWFDSVLKSVGVRLTGRRHSDLTTRADLLAKCRIEGDCWVHSSTQAMIGAKRVNAQRAAFILFVGPLHKDARVFASCGNATCCLPEHLSLCGTVAKPE